MTIQACKYVVNIVAALISTMNICIESLMWTHASFSVREKVNTPGSVASPCPTHLSGTCLHTNDQLCGASYLCLGSPAPTNYQDNMLVSSSVDQPRPSVINHRRIHRCAPFNIQF